MLCYRDMTFCTYYKECKDGKDCRRALTDEVQKAAEAWMKEPPISIFGDKPECFKEAQDV